MVSAVTSSSSALKVLQTQAPEQAASGRDEPGPVQRFLDPRSTLVLPLRSLDALLQMRAELRRDRDLEPQVQQEAPPASSASRPEQPNTPAVWVEATMPYRSCLDEWKSSMMWLQDHPNIFPDRTVPLDSPLSPWNSREVIQQLIYEDAQRMISTTRRHALIDRGLGGHQSMDRTWPDDGAQIRNTAHGQWYDDNQFPDQKSDEDFFREIRVYTLYGPNLTLSIDPYNPVSKALLQGTAQIIRATDVPGFRNFQGRHTTYTYDSTANRYEWAGTMVESYNNGPRILEDVKKKNPTMEVVLVYGDDFTHDDAAFILYPKTSSAAQ